MIVINSTKIVYFDVDNTLVFTQVESPPEMSDLVSYTTIKGRTFNVHFNHCEMIQDFKARGHTVVVWSAGGAEWAKVVVETLELESYVDLVIGKPDWIFDDQRAEDFMPSPCYQKI